MTIRTAGSIEDRADFAAASIQQAKLSSGRSYGELVQQWFKTSLFQFQPNAPGTFGNTGKNILRGPRTFAPNLALVKDTKMTDQCFRFRRNVSGAGVLLTILVCAGAPETLQTKLRTLDRVAQIRALSPSEASQGLPVLVRGVVTHYDPALPDLFVQGATGG